MMKLHTLTPFFLTFLVFWTSSAFAIFPCTFSSGEVQVGEHDNGGHKIAMCESDSMGDIQNMPSGSPMPMEHREMLWGALAIDKKKVLVNDKELKFIGVSSMKKDMKEAQKAAMDMCKSDGSKDCELVQTALNQCLSISIASKDNGMAYFFAPTVQDAMTISQQKCKQAHKECKVAHTACSNANF